MLIAITIAEEIQGLGGSENFELLNFLGLKARSFSDFWETSFQSQKILQNFYAIFCNPWIPSAMAMAMSIYRTLCVLVRVGIRQQNGDWIEANDQPTQPIRTNLPDEDWSQSFSSQFFVHAKEVDLNLNNVASILFCFNLKPEKSYRLSPTS